MKKALVIGGRGFVGSAIVRRLAARGVQVVAVDMRGFAGQDLPEVRFFQGDIRNKKFLMESCQGCDTVFHVAARKGGWGPCEEFHEVNVAGTRNVIDACLANRVANLIYTSSASVVFEGIDTCGVNELIPYASRFRSHYARTKMLAEAMVLGANSGELQATALRPHFIWGPGDNLLIPRLVKRGALGQLKIIGDGRNIVDISYIDNVVDAHLLAADSLETDGKAAGEAYFISQGEPVVFWNWVNRLLRQLELPAVEEAVSFKKAYWQGFFWEHAYRLLRIQKEPRITRHLAEELARSQWFSIAKAKRDLRYQPAVSTAEGLQRTVEWIKTAAE